MFSLPISYNIPQPAPIKLTSLPAPTSPSAPAPIGILQGRNVANLIKLTSLPAPKSSSAPFSKDVFQSRNVVNFNTETFETSVLIIDGKRWLI